MARITVEDCIDKFPSRFELVLVASNRARKLHSGEDPTVEKDNDKNTVIALREIAQETISAEQLKNDLVEEYQTTSLNEEEVIEDDIEDKNDDTNNSSQDQLIEDKQTEVVQESGDTLLESNDINLEADNQTNEDQNEQNNDTNLQDS